MGGWYKNLGGRGEGGRGLGGLGGLGVGVFEGYTTKTKTEKETFFFFKKSCP